MKLTVQETLHVYVDPDTGDPETTLLVVDGHCLCLVDKITLTIDTTDGSTRWCATVSGGYDSARHAFSGTSRTPIDITFENVVVRSRDKIDADSKAAKGLPEPAFLKTWRDCAYLPAMRQQLDEDSQR